MEALPNPEPDNVVPITKIPKILHLQSYDTFLNGLSLGVWDDSLGYYRPKDLPENEDKAA